MIHEDLHIKLLTDLKYLSQEWSRLMMKHYTDAQHLLKNYQAIFKIILFHFSVATLQNDYLLHYADETLCISIWQLTTAEKDSNVLINSTVIKKLSQC
jgi:hypothetical protein